MTESSERPEEREASVSAKEPVDYGATQAEHEETSAAKEITPPYDGEAGERPVREQLKNTSITAQDVAQGKLEEKPVDTAAASDATSIGPEDKDADASSVRGRVRRKRSFEELAGEQADGRTSQSSSKHPRKSSLDVDGEHRKDSDETGSEQGTSSIPSPAEDELSDEPNRGSGAYEQTEASILKEERPHTPPATSDNLTVPPDEMAISPQNKRNRDQFVKDHEADYLRQSTILNGSTAPVGTKATDKLVDSAKATFDEPESKRFRDEVLQAPIKEADKEAPKIPSSSGFSNTSTQSPFSALAPKPSSPPLRQSSLGPFASSGFASFASASQSPFGTIAAPSSSTIAKDTGKSGEAETPALGPSGFGSLSSSKSPFATAGESAFGAQSGFGKLSNGFGTGGFGSASLSSFASPGTSKVMGSSKKAPRPFGAPEDSDEEEGDGSDAVDGSDELPKIAAEEEAKDSRFFEQEVETGEENEETIFQSRAKLYVSIEQQWKERGVGYFKVNVSAPAEDEAEETSSKKSARFIMRADGSHRIVLNSPIKRGINVEDPSGGPPKGKSAIFLGFLENKPTMMQVKMRSNVLTEELHNVVTSLQEGM